MSTYTPSGQLIVPPRLEPVGLRYYLGTIVLDDAGAKISVRQFFEHPEPIAESEVENIAREFAREKGHAVSPEARVWSSIFWPLKPIPRPPASDPRPLLSWEIYLDFVCHDVKYAAGSTQSFAWPEEPVGLVLGQYQDLVITDSLCARNDGPSYAPYTEVCACTVRPSAELPTRFR